MLGSVKWNNLNPITIPHGEVCEQDVDYETLRSNALTLKGSEFIGDVKLAIHGSTGAQLANLPNKNVTIDGVAWSCKDNEVTVIGSTGEDSVNTLNDLFYDIPIVSGQYHISGSSGSVNVGVIITDAHELSVYYGGDNTFTLSGNERLAKVYLYVDANANVNSTVKVMLNKGNTQLPFEPYTGGTPYTDKYNPTITDQGENTVTLSIENVSATEGDITELDVVLTDIFGVTKRSEQGKSFSGGGGE